MLVHRIVLTGGPCGGKSAVIEALQKQRRPNVVVQEEVASLILRSVARPPLACGVSMRQWQGELARLHLAYDTCMLRLAEGISQQQNSAVVIVSDRGALDGAAFLSEREWKQVRSQMAIPSTRSGVHVVHLESVACRFPSRYLHERGFRAEGPTRAAYLDRKLIDIWRGCASWRSVRSYANFPKKLEKSLLIVNALLESLLLGDAGKMPPPITLD